MYSINPDKWTVLSILFIMPALLASHLCAQTVIKTQSDDSHTVERTKNHREGRRGRYREALTPDNDSLLFMDRYVSGLSCLLDARIRKAGKYFKDALEAEFAAGSVMFREKCLSKLALVYINQYHTREAEEACLGCVGMAEARGDSASTMYYLLTLYKAEAREGNFKSARHGLEGLISFFRRNNNLLALAGCHQALSACCANTGDKSGFEFHIREAEQASLQLGLPKVTLFVRLIRAEGLLRFEEYHEVSVLVNQSLDMCRQYDYPELAVAFAVLQSECLIKTGATSVVINQLMTETLERAQSLDLVHLCAAIKSKQLELADPSRQSAVSVISPDILLTGLDCIDEVIVAEELKSCTAAVRAPEIAVLSWPVSVRALLILFLMLFFSVSASVLGINLGGHLDWPNRYYIPAGYAVPGEDEDEKLLNLYKAILERMETEKPYLDMNFSISTLGAIMNRSERYLSLAINKAGKTNFNRLVIRFRVNEACSLIRKYEGSITMNEVAEMSGFANRMSFTRRFREITGMSPTEYLDKIHAE